MMPGIDGIGMLRGAREIDRNLIGIIMTGAGTISTAVEAMKTGAFDFILKPFKLNVILPVLARAVAFRDLRSKNAALEEKVRLHNLHSRLSIKNWRPLPTLFPMICAPPFATSAATQNSSPNPGHPSFRKRMRTI